MNNIYNKPGYPVFIFNKDGKPTDVVSDIGLYLKVTRENPWQDISKNMSQLTPNETSWNFYLTWGFKF